jgi:hypothetical protein
MTPIHEDIKHQLRLVAEGRSKIKGAEQRLRNLLEVLLAQLPNAVALSADIWLHLGFISQGRGTLKRAEQRLKQMLQALFTNLPDTVDRATETPPLPEVTEAMLERAEHAVQQVGLRLLDQQDLSPAESTSPRKSTVRAIHPPPGDDMRAIERTATGKYRCTLRRGRRKHRLIPEVFETKEEAPAARNALEHQLRRALPVRRGWQPRTS